MIISLSIGEGAGEGGRKPFLIDYFSYSSVENPECFSRNIEANWSGKGGGGGGVKTMTCTMQTFHSPHFSRRN